MPGPDDQYIHGILKIEPLLRAYLHRFAPRPADLDDLLQETYSRLLALKETDRDAIESTQAFALTMRLHETDCFSWGEWTAALAAELRRAAERGEPDDDAAHYYEHWVAALEGLVTAKGLTDAESLDCRKHAWAEAYRRTPHGQPVELGG